MKLSAFTFLRNAEQLGYPYIASILSIIEYVDEFVVNIGLSTDNTLASIQALQKHYPHIRIIESCWNEAMASKGFVYAQQKMIAQYNCTGDWAFYLEGDEVMHEADMQTLKKQIAKYHHNQTVEAFAFNYHHFYGTAKYVAISPAWYRQEVRIIRNTMRTYCPDGLFWMVMSKHRKGRYPKAIVLDAHIYHYGHVRKQDYAQAKNNQVAKYWSEQAKPANYGNIDPQSIQPWQGGVWGTHPKVISDWLSYESQQTLEFVDNYQATKREKKHRLSMRIENLCKKLGWRLDLSKKHFIKVKV